MPKQDVTIQMVPDLLCGLPEFKFLQQIPVKVYICATMWHETIEEMETFLNSILRCDEDQFARRTEKLTRGINKQDTIYYESEVHIFFDDAFGRDVHCKHGRKTYNEYVKNFLQVLSSLLKSDSNSFKFIDTPYGSQCTSTLPSGMTLVLHLKDKAKIRNKKRWSQVMYIHYLLDWKHQFYTSQNQDDCYILAIDGDVNFEPDSLTKLVTIMEKDKSLGALCGRIYPTGSGPIIWFQKTEYAIAHWLYKSTESLVGSVLCCPGCFSLYRASALMAENVKQTYSKNTEQGIQFLLYDQGEDRWLTSLVRHSGKRTGYCADALAATHAPETLEEFYKQRRRWSPSSQANNIAFLAESGRQLPCNLFRIWFLLYHFLNVISGLLTPGITLFILMHGFVVSNNILFNISSQHDLVFSGALVTGIPAVLFMLVCLCTSEKIQFAYAKFLSVFYGVLSLLSMMGLFINIFTANHISSSAFLLLGCFAPFIASIACHRSDLNFVMLVVFILGAPSYYLITLIYAICNMNIISWGTREFAVNRQACPQTIRNKKFTKISSKANTVSQKIKCLLLKSFCTLLHFFCKPNRPLSRKLVTKLLQSIDEGRINYNAFSTKPDVKVLSDCYCKTESFQNCERLDEREIIFWKNLISSYLTPNSMTKQHHKKVLSEMKSIRNISTIFLFCINFVYVVLGISYDLDKSTHVTWFLDRTESVSPVYIITFSAYMFVLGMQIFSMIIYRVKGLVA